MYLALEYIFYCCNNLLIKVFMFPEDAGAGEKEYVSEFKFPVPHRIDEKNKSRLCKDLKIFVPMKSIMCHGMVFLSTAESVTVSHN